MHNEREDMSLLSELVSRCKCGVHLHANDHLDVYQTIEEAVHELEGIGFAIDPDMRAKIIETGMLIDLQFYPHTPVGFYKVIHYDIEAALQEAIDCLNAQEPTR